MPDYDLSLFPGSIIKPLIVRPPIHPCVTGVVMRRAPALSPHTQGMTKHRMRSPSCRRRLDLHSIRRPD